MKICFPETRHQPVFPRVQFKKGTVVDNLDIVINPRVVAVELLRIQIIILTFTDIEVSCNTDILHSGGEDILNPERCPNYLFRFTDPPSHEHRDFTAKENLVWFNIPEYKRGMKWEPLGSQINILISSFCNTYVRHRSPESILKRAKCVNHSDWENRI